MPTTIYAVSQHSVEKFRYAVEKSSQREDNTEARLGDTLLGGQARHCEREVLADKVEEDVADHSSDDGTPLPILEFFLLFRCYVMQHVYCLILAKVTNFSHPTSEYFD